MQVNLFVEKKLTFGDDALNADHVAKHGTVERPGRDMTAAKTTLKANVKILVALSVSGIHAAHKLLQCSLKRLLLLECIFHQAENTQKNYKK